jgi:hypothetical protein
MWRAARARVHTQGLGAQDPALESRRAFRHSLQQAEMWTTEWENVATRVLNLRAADGGWP